MSAICACHVFLRLSEQAEVDASVGAVLDESGHVFKRVVLSVFKYEHASRLEQAALQYHPGQRWKRGQGVRRVGEDEVEPLAAALYEAEHVAAKRHALVCAELLEALLYEGVMVAVGLYAYHRGASARQEFEGYAAGAREQVQGSGSVEVDVAVEHVEDVFLCKVSGRPRLECFWNVKMTSLVYSRYYAHFVNVGLKVVI